MNPFCTRAEVRHHIVVANHLIYGYSAAAVDLELKTCAVGLKMAIVAIVTIGVVSLIWMLSRSKAATPVNQDSAGVSAASIESPPLQPAPPKVDELVEWLGSFGGFMHASQPEGTAPDGCFFSVHVTHDRRGDDDPEGTLHLTDKHLIFISSEEKGSFKVPWAKVGEVACFGADMEIERSDRQKPTILSFNSDLEAKKAEAIIRLIRSDDALQQTHKGLVLEVSREYSAPSSKSLRFHDCSSGAGECGTGIAGESRYQAALRTLDGGRRRAGKQVYFTAELVPETTNPYDPNAVRVSTTGGDTLGFLFREDAAQYQAALLAIAASGLRLSCRAKLIGGSADKPSYGVMVDLKDPSDLTLGEQPF